MDKRLADLKTWIKDTSRPIPEIIQNGRQVRYVLQSLGYTSKTAQKYWERYFKPKSLPIFRVSLERWARERQAFKPILSVPYRRPRFVTPRQREALSLQRKGLYLAQIARKMGITLNSTRELIERGRINESIEANKK